MTALPDDVLRPLVADAVRAAMRDLRRAAAGPAVRSEVPAQAEAGVAGRTVETVSLADDRQLDAFVRRLVSLCDNPRQRQRLVSGQLRFALARTAHATAGRLPAGSAHQKIEKGVVTERMIKMAADRGQSLILGRSAVVTPLARDRARALNVSIEKET